MAITRKHGLVGQSQTQGTQVTEDGIICPTAKLVEQIAQTSTWMPGVVNWVWETRREFMDIVNVAQGSSSVTDENTAVDGDGIVHNWAPSYSGDNLWKERILGSVGSFSTPLITTDVTHLEVCFGAWTSGTGLNYEQGLTDFIDGILALMPGIKIMVHIAPAVQMSVKDLGHAGWESFLASRENGTNIFRGADFYGRMANKGDATTPGPLFEPPSQLHWNGEGYRWASREVIRAYALSGWLDA